MSKLFLQDNLKEDKGLFQVKKQCVIVGTTHMCVSILKLLKEYHWNILSVVSKDPIVIAYCEKSKTKIVRDLQQIKDKEFIIFSVINYTILSQDFLKSRKIKYAINYHDSLLPKYGGVNSTTWAIYNKESIHGVSWHLISSKIDEGDVIKQSSFVLDPHETAFSLNLKCSTEAVRLFGFLLDEFESGSLTLKKQDLRRKTYFGKSKIPENYGIIDFMNSFEEIDRIRRSLYFGGKNYPNPVGSLKIWDGSDFYLVDSLDFIKDEKAIPGKVYISSASSFSIGCAGGKLVIRDIRTSEGENISIKNTKFSKGAEIPCYCITQSEKEVLEKIKKSENKLVHSFFLENSSQNLFFATELVSKNPDMYHRSLSIGKQDFSLILSRVFLALFRFSDKDICIPVKSEVNTKSRFLDKFMYKMSLVKLGTDQKSLSYGEFVSFIGKHLEGGQFVLKDLPYRYHVEKFLSNLEIVLSNSVHLEEGALLERCRMRITITKKNIYIDGYEQDMEIINLIYSFIKYSINNSKLSNKTIVNDCFSSLINEKRNHFLCYNKTTNNELTKSLFFEGHLPSFLDMFERKALHQPQVLALIIEGKKFNYNCLNEKANQFARYLKGKGAQHGSLVGVALDRSLDLIVALIGIMKAGCIYLPLDPTHPSERIQFILIDADVDYLVTRSSLSNLFERNKQNVILIDKEQNNISKKQKTNLERKTDKNHLAYVIYTSGSTGNPKGVEVFESSLSNLIHSVRKRIRSTFNDRWLALTTISFDIAALELFLPLTQGASVVLATENDTKNPQKTIKLITDNEVTVIQATPSRYQMLVDAGWKGEQGLKILCGGESLPISLAKELIKKGACLWNLYGPTETTIWSSMARITASDQVITIGCPLDNTDFYILDEHLNVVPNGVQGELYIGGAGLARGYWNKKELTESKFISSPFGRLYRTGDLVRRLQDGRIEYIGRIDNQVKIRGFRVELGEIEEVLRKVKGIEQAVVLAHEVKQGDVRLIAYFQGRALQTDLEEAASSFLPTYMCPNIYIKVDQFPLTPNQKIDRNALPLPANFKGSDNYEKPGSVYEEKIAEVFAYHLGIEKVSVDADFFSLGGHSLLVVQVVSEINKSFCIELPLNSLFEHPSVRELALQVESSLKSGERNKKPIEKYPKNGLYPLSPSQKRIWFAEQIAPSKTLYSIPQVLEISGVLDVEKFQKAIQAVFQNHEILNAVFKDRDGEPMQVIKGLSKSPFRYFDYSGKRSPEKKARYFLSLEAKKGFDLKKGPLSRFILIRVSNKKHFFFFNFHHIIFDGLSTNVFLQDVRRCYELSSIAERKFFANHHPQYTDYISWEREKRVKSSTLSSVEFLKEKLKGISLTPFLPNDKERPKFLTHKGSVLNFLIKEKYADKIHSLVRENRTTLFTFMLTAFHVLLTRYSSRREFVIGVPSAGRDNVSLDSMIGCFINILPFPTSSKGDETFIDLLKRFRKESSEMFKHAEVPFDHLSNELEIDRSLNYSPIFQVMLNLLPRDSVQKMGDLEVNLKQLNRGMSHFDLSLTIQESSTEIMGYLEYSTEIFSRKMANGISRHFQSLVKEITKDPYQSTSQYQFLSPREVQEMTASWNNPTTEYNSKRTIVESFENQVTQTPKKIAVICGKEQLSYEELNREANKLAHTLLEKGIQPENKVVVCLDRTKEFIVAVLGILKAGAAYVPIDPQEPKDRVQSIFRDLAPSYIVTHSRVKLNFTYPNTLCLDQIDCLDNSNPSIRNLENHLAYIIYTSGSTGRPKGVEIEHGGINDRVMWKQTTYPLSSKDVMLHTYSFIFDGAIINYFWSLCAGSTLLIANNLEQYDPSALVQLIRKHRVSVTDMLPSLIHGVIEANDFEKCISLKYVFSGGEALSGEIVRMFYKNCSSATLYNTYGPTETTVEASVWECGPDFSGTVAPIGRPIAGAKLYVLDEHLNVVPTGVQGELYIGGKGLARSYLNDSKLTNNKFVNSPFDDGKLYRTGDLVKRNFEGDLEFLGRIDHQVKIRGYRVELGEIESTLLHMDQVERVAVVLDGKDIYKKIIAYVQLRPRMNESSFQPLMEQFLGKRLPGHMIPAQVVVMKDLPTLLNGKVNYKALPDPQKSAKAFSKSKERPTCENEIKLLSLWRELLDFADLSINDNFFEIGGNSLLAMRLITRINKEMKASLPLVSLFHHPTIKSLASFIKEPIKKQNKSTAVLMKGKGNKSPFFCVHPVGGNILCYNNLAKHWTNKRPFYALQARGVEEKERPLKSIKSMAREYINSIKEIQKEGPYFIGGWSFGGHVALEITRQLLEKGDEVGALIIIDTSVDIDKFRGIDINNEQNLYSELLDHYNIDPKKNYENLSPKEKLFQLLEWGGQKTCSIEKNKIKCTLNVAKSNYRALQKLSISPIKNVPVVLLRAQNNLKEAHDLGWGKYAEKLYVYNMPGNHWGIVDDCLSKSYALAIEKSINMACERESLVGSQI